MSTTALAVSSAHVRHPSGLVQNQKAQESREAHQVEMLAKQLRTPSRIGKPSTSR